MRRFLAALLALLLVASPVDAGTISLLHAGTGSPAAPSGYTGPGDVVSSATGFYSCSRGYSAAYSTGSNKGCNLRRASDNTTQDINILSNGDFDTASANSFAGTDATCQGSTTGLSVTIAFTSCSATPKAADTVTGSGISQPEYLTACGSFVGGAGSCTLTTAQNIGVAETVTMQVALFVTEAYDQSGNTFHVTQGTAATQPQWLPSCISSKPCFRFLGSQLLFDATTADLAQPNTVTAVAQRTGAFTSTSVIIGSGISGGQNSAMGGLNSTNTLYEYNNGSTVSVTASDSVTHAYAAVFNGASSALVVDGVNTNETVGSLAFFSGVFIGNVASGGGQQFTGDVEEAGLWGSAFNGTQKTNMCHNQFIYYGTATSC